MNSSVPSRFVKFSLLLLALAAMAGPAAHAGEAPAPEACTLTCDAAPSMYSGPPPLAVTFRSIVNSTGCAGSVTYQWGISDGATSVAPSFDRTFTEVGQYNWAFTVTADGQSCTKTGTIYVRSTHINPPLTASAAPTTGTAPLVVQFQAANGRECTDGDGYFPPYTWYFEDGSGTNEQNPARTYTTPGFKQWTVTSHYWDNLPSWCWHDSIGGYIMVEGCFQVGSLDICADDRTQDPGTETYHFSGNVVINGSLKFSGDVTVVLPSAGATTGVLTTSGSISVQFGTTTETLLQGAGLSFDLDGAAGTMTPGFSDTEWAASLAGMQLWVSGTPIQFGPEGVTIEPTIFAGYGSLTLFSCKATILYPPQGDKRLLGAQILQGEITPGLKFLDLSFNYDYVLDQLTG